MTQTAASSYVKGGGDLLMPKSAFSNLRDKICDINYHDQDILSLKI
ncbi:MAG: hypothetical protein HQK91_08225 [Nitrospirae bacterium]|nr:hypothetical protein [Nitrospirota bacterium]